MPMDLPLDAPDEEHGDTIAAPDRLSESEIVRLPIEERAARRAKSARIRAIFERIQEEDADLLDALSK